MVILVGAKKKSKIKVQNDGVIAQSQMRQPTIRGKINEIIE